MRRTRSSCASTSRRGRCMRNITAASSRASTPRRASTWRSARPRPASRTRCSSAPRASGVPVVAVMADEPDTPFSVITLKKDNIVKPEQLKGKKLSWFQSNVKGLLEPLLKKRGFPVNVMPLRDYGVQFYGTVIYTSDQLLKSNPDLVRRFVRATLKSLIWTRDN